MLCILWLIRAVARGNPTAFSPSFSRPKLSPLFHLCQYYYYSFAALSAIYSPIFIQGNAAKPMGDSPPPAFSSLSWSDDKIFCTLGADSEWIESVLN
jgi:hypothetical protein